MDFTFTEEQEMLKKSVRDFLTAKCPKSYVKQMEADEKGYTLDLWGEMAGLGWQGLVLPEKYGGSALQFLDLAVLCEEMGRACLPGPFFSTVVLGALTILESGTDAQKDRYLPGIASGKTIVTLALNEKDARYNARAISLRATVNKDGYLLNGTKLFVPDAQVADYLLVVARTRQTVNPERGITVFIVDAKSPGITVAPLKTIAHDKLCEVTFERVKVTGENIVGGLGRGWGIARRAIERAAAARCCDTAGVLQRVLEMTLDYAKERKQFEKPIGSFQVIQHYLAEVATDVDGARFSAYQAAWRLSEGKPAVREIAIAKTFAADAFERIITKSHQIFGAIGVTVDHDLHFYTTRGKAAMLSWGDGDYWREYVAQAMG
ncbi:MAG: acyl-CoA dehydrogenase family protein, partial [Dehalococcoidia bacterium]|nr:acyl-CoA dehydrogenase family protein [Dehalococcoidia bacterium]